MAWKLGSASQVEAVTFRVVLPLLQYSKSSSQDPKK